MAKMALADCSGVDDAVIAKAPLLSKVNSPRGRVPFLWTLRWEGFDLTQISQFRLPPLSAQNALAARASSRLMAANLSLLAAAHEVIE